jgi:hypothetical protein
MTTWLERREKIQQHNEYLQQTLTGHSSCTMMPKASLALVRCIKMTRLPTKSGVSIDVLVSDYGATYFRDAFARYVVGWKNPEFNRSRVERESLNVNIPFVNVSVYHRIKFVNTSNNLIVDALHVQPGQECPGRFDTALVRLGDSAGRSGGIQGKAKSGYSFRLLTIFAWQQRFG